MAFVRHERRRLDVQGGAERRSPSPPPSAARRRAAEATLGRANGKTVRNIERRAWSETDRPRRGRGLANFGGTGGLACASMRSCMTWTETRTGATAREFSLMADAVLHGAAFDLWTKLGEVGRPATRARREIEKEGNVDRLVALALKSRRGAARGNRAGAGGVGEKTKRGARRGGRPTRRPARRPGCATLGTLRASSPRVLPRWTRSRRKSRRRSPGGCPRSRARGRRRRPRRRTRRDRGCVYRQHGRGSGRRDFSSEKKNG